MVSSKSIIFPFFASVLLLLPGIISSGLVTLKSIEINKTYEWMNADPTIYFQCKGENKTILPDVKRKNVSYVFKGEESWQPMMKLEDKKCKRCGLYEKDTIKADDIFDEWELCSSDFKGPNGQYIHLKDKEFTVTFICAQCNLKSRSDSIHSTHLKRVVAIVMISTLVSTVSILGVIASCRHWQKKKRQRDQARFLKLFEDEDDIEEEWGLGI